MLAACLRGLNAGTINTVVDVAIEYSAVAHVQGMEPPTGDNKLFRTCADGKLAVEHDGYAALSLFCCHCGGQHTGGTIQLNPGPKTYLFPGGKHSHLRKAPVKSQSTTTQLNSLQHIMWH